MENHDKKIKAVYARKEVNHWGQRVHFWVDWNLRVIRNDPQYVSILNEVKNNRHKAFNRYLRIINEDETLQEELNLDIKKIKEIK